MTTREEVDGIRLITDESEKYLNQRQREDYRGFREDLVRWMLNLGKDPEKAVGYAYETARQRSYRIDRFYRWIWRKRDSYTLKATPEDAEEYSRELAYKECSTTHKAAIQKAIQTLFKFRRFQGRDVEWEPDIKFSSNSGTHHSRDFLTRAERRQIKEAVLEYGSIPSYEAITPRQRDKWKQYLAQRFEKPKSEVDPADWDRANGWKYASIVWTSMDTGLRPKEVGRATTDWLDLENRMLRIPKEESTKNTENWNVGLSSRTANILRRWVGERKQYDKYDATNSLWLTKYGNSYKPKSLNRLLRKLCEEADIPVDNRSITWYSIRHSVGTYMARDNGLAAAQAQLRHKSERTTMRYDQAPVEDRKKTLDNWD